MLPAETLRSLRSSLPPPPARLLVLGEGASASSWVGALAGAGHEVTARRAGLERRDDGGRFDAILVAEPSALVHPLAPAVQALRALLVEGGRWALAGSLANELHGAASPALDDFIEALSETGFCIERAELLGRGGSPEERDAALLVARRDPYVVRPYRPGDETAIVALFHRAFHPRRSLDSWQWRNTGSPFGQAKMSLAFAPEGELVAHYAGHPIHFCWASHGGARTLLGLHIGDTMTLPSARHVGRGETSLLGRTVRHFYARNCNGRVAFNYGFNRGNIQKFSLRFVRAHRIEPVPFWQLDAHRFPSARSLPRWLSGLRVETVRETTAEWDDFLQLVAPHYGFLVQRDARYLRWRYLECPDVRFVFAGVRWRGRLAGWGVFRRDGERLLWGDALFDPTHCPEAPRALLRHVLALPEHRNVRRIEAWFSARPLRWVNTLSRLGFHRQAEPNDLALMGVPFTEADAHTTQLPRLYYTWGDSDLF